MSSRANEIVVEEISAIKPALETKCRICNLAWTDLTLLSINYNQKCIVFGFPGSSASYDEWFQEAMSSMKKALEKTLVHFYPFAGRLKTVTGSIFIDCNDQGAQFIQASAQHVCVEDILQDDIPPLVKELFPINGAVNANGQHSPLLVIQATRLKDGMVIALTANHLLVDGTSFWHFIQSWPEICRGCSNISNPPIHTRSFGMEESETPIPSSFTTLMSSITPYSPLNFSPPNWRETLFHFSKDTITHIKEEANKYTKKEGRPIISSFQSVCVHIWQAITIARKLPDEVETSFQLSVNCRNRVNPPLTDSYWGNAIQPVRVTLTAKQVVDSHVSELAHLLNTKIVAHQDSAIKSLKVIKPLEFNMKNGVMEIDESQNMLVMGSSHRFPVYDTDFGWGRPLGVRSGWANKFDGKLTAYPSATGDGGIDVEICLRPEVMCTLQSYPLCRALLSSPMQLSSPMYGVSPLLEFLKNLRSSKIILLVHILSGTFL